MNGAIGEAGRGGVPGLRRIGRADRHHHLAPGHRPRRSPSTAVDAAASWAAFRAAVVRFMTRERGERRRRGEAADPAGSFRRDGRHADRRHGGVASGTGCSKNIPAGNIVMSSNALAAPTGSAVCMQGTADDDKNGVPPIFVGTWGAIDLIRDPYSDAASRRAACHGTRHDGPDRLAGLRRSKSSTGIQ